MSFAFHIIEIIMVIYILAWLLIEILVYTDKIVSASTRKSFSTSHQELKFFSVLRSLIFWFEVVGNFLLGGVFIGKFFSSGDLILHQCFPSGNIVTFWLKHDKKHLNLEGTYWHSARRGEKFQIVMRRTPDLYQKALDYARIGDVDKLKELVKTFFFI